MQCLLFLATALWLSPFNVAGDNSLSGCSLPDQDLDEESLQLLQRAVVKGHAGFESPEASVGHLGRAEKVVSTVDGDSNSTGTGSIERGVKAVMALEKAQLASDLDQWPHIEEMIHSVSSVVTQSVDQLGSTVTLAFQTIEAHARKMFEECRAAKESLLEGMNATLGSKLEERLSTFEDKANHTLGVFSRHFGSLGKELQVLSNGITKSLTAVGQVDLASHTGEAFGVLTNWAESFTVTIDNVSDALVGIHQHSQHALHQKVNQLNATLEALLIRVELFADSFLDAALNVTEGAATFLSSKLPHPLAAVVSKTLDHARDTAKASGEYMVDAAREVTTGIEEASVSTGMDKAHGHSSRQSTGFSILLAMLLVGLRVSWW